MCLTKSTFKFVEEVVKLVDKLEENLNKISKTDVLVDITQNI
jgi:hypothetical protein